MPAAKVKSDQTIYAKTTAFPTYRILYESRERPFVVSDEG
jgi:hypothetical protein